MLKYPATNIADNKKPKHMMCLGLYLAEGVGFEPTDGRPSTVFKTVALSRSATPPNGRDITKGQRACKHLIQLDKLTAHALIASRTNGELMLKKAPFRATVELQLVT